MKTAIHASIGKFAGLGLLLAIFAVAAAQPVAGPVKLIHSQPEAAGAVENPLQIDLWFDRDLSDHFNGVWVFPDQEIQLPLEERTSLVRGQPFLSVQDRTHLTAELMPLPPGRYSVQWRVQGHDGNDGAGQFDFFVAESAVRATRAQ